MCIDRFYQTGTLIATATTSKTDDAPIDKPKSYPAIGCRHQFYLVYTYKIYVYALRHMFRISCQCMHNYIVTITVLRRQCHANTDILCKRCAVELEANAMRHAYNPRYRSVFMDTSMRRAAERRTLSRRAVRVRGRPTETELH